jgi:uncharacterized protein YcfJ
MRGQVLIAVSALALAFAQPAAAQQYRTYQDGYVAQSRACQQSHTNRTVGGAAIGGVTGAVIGSQFAAHGHRGDGSLLGAVVGAVIGGAIGNSTARESERCKADVEGRYDPYYGYAQAPYDDRYADAGDDYNDDELEGGPDGYYSGK